MRFRFLLSAPQHDIELIPEDLEQPFLVNPHEQHPFLTLNDYFGSLQKFIMSCGSEQLKAALAAAQEIVVRSEKHGAFYHIASIAAGGEKKFVVITALAERARASLKIEFLLLRQLAGLQPEFLPAVFAGETITQQTDSGSEEFYMVLGQWLNDYHEWHLRYDPITQKQQVQLWDYQNGFRILSRQESYEVLRQAAYILTYYYDQSSYHQIYPWHHGAGDFVVKADNDGIRVKLITARQYEPLIFFEEEEKSDRLIGAIHFLLNLCLKIRLDRFDGTGEPAWFEDFAVDAAVAGFVDGLAAMETADRLLIGPITEFMELMRSFDADEFLEMYASLLAVYGDEDQDDFQLIQSKIAGHAEELHAVLQSFRTEDWAEGTKI